MVSGCFSDGWEMKMWKADRQVRRMQKTFFGNRKRL